MCRSPVANLKAAAHPCSTDAGYGDGIALSVSDLPLEAHCDAENRYTHPCHLDDESWVPVAQVAHRFQNVGLYDLRASRRRAVVTTVAVGGGLGS